MSDIRVSFAYITPQSIECCWCDAGSSREIDNPSFIENDWPLLNDKVALVRILNFSSGSSRVVRAHFPENATIADLHKALDSFDGTKRVEFVSFAPATAALGECAYTTISQVLTDEDSIPSFLFCQRMTQCGLPIQNFLKWIVVNTLICSNDGELAVGNVPFVVPSRFTGLAKDDFFIEISRVLCLNAECERELQKCPLLTCASEGRRIVLREAFQGNSVTDQVALIYGAAEIGDIALVNAQWHKVSSNASSAVVQGVVTRRSVKDGIILYDVKEMDTAVVMEGLTRTQFVIL